MAGMQHRRRNFTAVAWRIVLEASSVLPTKQQTTPAVSHALQPAHRTQPANPTNPKPNPTQLNLPHPTQPTPPYLTYPTLTYIHPHQVDQALDRGRCRPREPEANLPDGSDGLPRQLRVYVAGVLSQFGDDRLGRVAVREQSQAAHLGVFYSRRLVVPAEPQQGNQPVWFGFGWFYFVSFCFVSVRFGSVWLGLLWLGWVELG